MVYINNTHQGISESDSAYSNRRYFAELDGRRIENEKEQQELCEKLTPEEKLAHDRAKALGGLFAVICSLIYSLLFG